MVGQIINYLFYGVIASLVLGGLFNLIRANIYDYRWAKRRAWEASHPNARYLRQRPNIHVVVFADNDQATMQACLDSLIAINYRKLSVTIVNNASSDNTKQIIKAFLKEYGSKHFKTINKRRRGQRAEVVAATARQIKSDYVFIIDANCVLEPELIPRALPVLNKGASAVTIKTEVEHNYSLGGLAAKYRAIITNVFKKSGGFIPPSLDTNNYAAFYKTDLFKRGEVRILAGLNNLNQLQRIFKQSAGGRLVYCKAACVRVYPRHTFKPQLALSSDQTMLNLLNIGRGLLAFLEPVIGLFMLVVALKFHNSGYIALAWLSFTLLLLLSVWSDESRSFWQKLKFSLISIPAYSIYIWQLSVGIIRAVATVFRRPGKQRLA